LLFLFFIFCFPGVSTFLLFTRRKKKFVRNCRKWVMMIPSSKDDYLITTKGMFTLNTQITNELTLIYSGLKLKNGAMLTQKFSETFEDAESESEWISKMVKELEVVPDEWGLSYSFKRA